MIQHLILREGKEPAQSFSTIKRLRRGAHSLPLAFAVAFFSIWASTARASSHYMPVSQIIGGSDYTGPTNSTTIFRARDSGKLAQSWPEYSLSALHYRGRTFDLKGDNSANYDLTEATPTFTNNGSAEFLIKAQSVSSAHLLNISTRTRVETGEKVLIGGFIITGGGTKRVVLRGIGPSLTAAGVKGVLADPVLELHKPDGKVITNDNWYTQRVDLSATGIAPSSNKESAIVANLPAGSYTAILRGKNNTSGIGLVEVYDLDTAAAAELINISSRGFVAIGDNVLIGGIIVGPSGSTGSRMLVRAIGPSLVRSGIANPLPDPTLELHNKDGALIASNDNWKDTQQAAIQTIGVPPSDDRESAIVFTAVPGNYTAIVRGRNGTTGLALVEVYNLH